MDGARGGTRHAHRGLAAVAGRVHTVACVVQAAPRVAAGDRPIAARQSRARPSQGLHRRLCTRGRSLCSARPLLPSAPRCAPPAMGQPSRYSGGGGGGGGGGGIRYGGRHRTHGRVCDCFTFGGSRSSGGSGSGCCGGGGSNRDAGSGSDGNCGGSFGDSRPLGHYCGHQAIDDVPILPRARPVGRAEVVNRASDGRHGQG
mmetsp:Transcript_70490/g.212005  ORF Transcript_70490/g.212005 Transcript_70490/m.212005 type:complete len:201 (-) Transcript_70490:202-804(-)